MTLEVISALCMVNNLLPVEVHLNGMVDDKISRTHRVDLLRISTQLLYCVTHCSKIHHCGDPTANSKDIHSCQRNTRRPNNYLFICCLVLLLALQHKTRRAVGGK